MTTNDPVQPERSNVYDIGVEQKIYAVPGLDVGVDAYYKTATDLLDDGQFGAAYVLSAFNYAYAQNIGVEFKANYTNGNFCACMAMWPGPDSAPPKWCRTSICSIPTTSPISPTTTSTPTMPSC